MTEKVRDVVCNMWVNPDNAAAKAEYQDEKYYFCSPGCKIDFLKEPGKYLHTKSHQDHEPHSHQH